jgi:hypothetical protein
MLAMFEKKHEDDTIMARLGSAKESSPLGFFTILFLVLACIAGFFYFNFKAMALATGGTGLVKHGLAYTFAQPLYSFWAIYYVLLGHKSQ